MLSERKDGDVWVSKTLGAEFGASQFVQIVIKSSSIFLFFVNIYLGYEIFSIS